MVACCEYKIVSVPPFVAFTITIKGEGAFYFCVVCIFPSSHECIFDRSLSKNDLPQEIRKV